MGHSHAAVGSYTPVCRGALLRYKSVLPRGMPSNEAFGIGKVEVWEPVLHPEASYFTGADMGEDRVWRGNYPIPRPDIVEKDPYDNDIDIVYERWLPIMEKGQVKKPGQPFKTETWQQQIVPVRLRQLPLHIYWTEKDIHEHNPIREGGNALDSKLRDGIECWGNPLEMKLPDLASLGFEELESRGHSEDKAVYEFYWRLIMDCDGANIKVKWQIASPGTQPYDEYGDERRTKVEIAMEGDFELCEGTHSPFTREAVE